MLRGRTHARRAVLTSSEADQRSPLLRSIDRPSAREVRQAAKRAKESFGVGCRAWKASIFCIMYGDMEGGGAPAKRPADYGGCSGGKTFVFFGAGRLLCTAVWLSLFLAGLDARLSATRRLSIGGIE